MIPQPRPPAISTRRVALPLIAAALFAACSDSSNEPAPDDGGHVTHRSDSPRNTAPSATEGEISLLTRGGADFAFDLFGRFGSEGNLLVSPLGIRVAFAMVYGGAKGTTAEEMAAALRYDGFDEDALHDVFNALDLALAARILPEGPEGEDPVDLFLANSFWGRSGEEFLAEYLDLLAENYGSGVETLDFTNRPDESRSVINGWVEERTRDRIRDLLPEGSITANTAAVLVNALYFKAPWSAPFDENRTGAGTFRRADGIAVGAEMMRISEEFRYAEGEGYRALEMDFRGKELAALFLLPDEGGFDGFAEGLDGEALAGIVDGLAPAGVDVTLPKFTFESEFRLKETLTAMGMVVPFTSAADFTGMRSTGGLAIDEAYHKTFIDLNEKGVEAAAATAVVMNDTALPTPSETFTADRPFLFLIRDRSTGAVLFLGRLMDPSA
ncbi:MAG: serpin family protein [Candidatus Eisenbacteria bacterium]